MALNRAELEGRAYTVAEVAKLLGRGVAQTRALIRDGHLRGTVPPGRRGYTVTGEAIWAYYTGEPLPKGKAGR